MYFPHLRPEIKKHRIDFAGILTLVLAIVPAMLALTWGGIDYSWQSPQIIAVFAFSALMLLCFIWIENESREPILPLIIFKNRIVAVSLLVTLLTGFGMFGGIIFVPLFFQGVLGATATASGNFLSPMMLGIVLGSFVSGQFLARTGGHYKIQGGVGLTVLALGLALLSRMTLETSFAEAVFNITVAGIGLGVVLPLYTVAVQNSVSYDLLGVATSSTAFFRSLGGAFGLAVLGSVMHTRFAAGFIEGLPAALKTAAPMPQLMLIAHNPEALVHPAKQNLLKDALAQSGPQATELFQHLMQAMRLSLQGALADVFFVSLLVIAGAFVVNFFIKEIPLRRHHLAAGGRS